MAELQRKVLTDLELRVGAKKTPPWFVFKKGHCCCQSRAKEYTQVLPCNNIRDLVSLGRMVSSEHKELLSQSLSSSYMSKQVVLSAVNIVVCELLRVSQTAASLLGLAHPSVGSTEIQAQMENCQGKGLIRARKRIGRLIGATWTQLNTCYH